MVSVETNFTINCHLDYLTKIKKETMVMFCGATFNLDYKGNKGSVLRVFDLPINIIMLFFTLCFMSSCLEVSQTESYGLFKNLQYRLHIFQ